MGLQKIDNAISKIATMDFGIEQISFLGSIKNTCKHYELWFIGQASITALPPPPPQNLSVS